MARAKCVITSVRLFVRISSATERIAVRSGRTKKRVSAAGAVGAPDSARRIGSMAVGSVAAT